MMPRAAGWGRAYFALQAVAGAAWWAAVFTVPVVRRATLGSLDPVLVAALDIPLFVVASAVAAFGVRIAALIATGWTALVLVALAVWATATREAGWGVLAMAAATGCSLLALSLTVLGRMPTEWIASGPFRFRSADPRTGTVGHVARTGVQTLVFWGLFLVVLPLVVAFLERRWRLAIDPPPEMRVALVVVGVIVLAGATALGVASAAALSVRGAGTPLPSSMPVRLVVAGPYRAVRNPMAVAGIAQGVAVGLVLSSWLVVGYAIAGSVLWNYAVRPLEEADLEARFGDDFRRYRGSVRCWIPGRPVAAVRP